jgi:hypothetical protein
MNGEARQRTPAACDPGKDIDFSVIAPQRAQGTRAISHADGRDGDGFER